MVPAFGVNEKYLARKATFNDLGMDETSLQQMARSGFRFNNHKVVVCEGNGCGLKLLFKGLKVPNEQSVRSMNVSLGEMKIQDFAKISKMHGEACQYSESQHSSQNTAQSNILYDSTNGYKPIYNLSKSVGRYFTLSEFDNKYSPRESDSISYTQHSKDGVFFDANTNSLDCYYCGDSLQEALTASHQRLNTFLTNHQQSVSTDRRHPGSADPSSAGAHSSPPPPPAPGQPGVAQSTPGQAQRSREPGTVQSSTPATHQHPSPQAQTLPAQTPPVPTPQALRQSCQTGVSGQSHEQVVNLFAQLSINDRESNTPGINTALIPRNPDYASEQARINSFSTGSGWPSDKSQTPQQLAEAGFFFLGAEDIVRCFYCDFGLKDWKRGEEPYTEHARHFPDCSYLKQKKGQRFIDDVQAQKRHNTSGINKTSLPKRPDYASEQARIDSFSADSGWPSDKAQTPQSMAEAGFFFTGLGDDTRCFHCNGGLKDWEDVDEPYTEHARHYPNCFHLEQKKGQRFIDDVQARERVMQELTARNAPINQTINNRESNTPGINTSLPKHPAYALKQARIDSFSADSGWPFDKTQTPESMAEAGFFYTGVGDITRCFYCNGGLKKWDNGARPDTEHARCYPNCSYLIEKKGQRFIDNVQALVRPARRKAPINQTPRDRSDVSNAWESEPAVSTVKQMGYSLDQIRPAYDLVRSRKHKVDVPSLMDEILNLEDDANERHSVEEPAGREIVQAGENDELPQEAVTERNSVSAARAGEQIAAQQHSGHRTAKPEERNSASGEEWSEANRGEAELQKENERLKEERLCTMCLAQDAVIVFIPCGHLCTCPQCADTVANCPMCSRSIKEKVKTYRS